MWRRRVCCLRLLLLLLLLREMREYLGRVFGAVRCGAVRWGRMGLKGIMRFALMNDF